jgi:hypothetical protein
MHVAAVNSVAKQQGPVGGASPIGSCSVHRVSPPRVNFNTSPPTFVELGCKVEGNGRVGCGARQRTVNRDCIHNRLNPIKQLRVTGWQLHRCDKWCPCVRAVSCLTSLRDSWRIHDIPRAGRQGFSDTVAMSDEHSKAIALKV